MIIGIRIAFQFTYVLGILFGVSKELPVAGNKGQNLNLPEKCCRTYRLVVYGTRHKFMVKNSFSQALCASVRMNDDDWMNT